LLYKRPRRSASFRSYGGLTRAFFESICAVSGKLIIVDYSKIGKNRSPCRARLDRRRGCRLFRKTDAGRAQRRREQDKGLGIITLRPDAQEWKRALSPTKQRLSWALIGWLMGRYDNKRDVLVRPGLLAGVGPARETTGNLLALKKLRTAVPRRMWRELAEFR
jgi:hypothetical protein